VLASRLPRSSDHYTYVGRAGSREIKDDVDGGGRFDPLEYLRWNEDPLVSGQRPV